MTSVKLTETSAFANAHGDATLDELLSRRWLYRKGEYVAVSRPGVEYAIDWSLADRVLQTIATLADSRAGRGVDYSEVVASGGLPTEKVDELMAELGVLGLAHLSILDDSRIDVAEISRDGLSRLARRAPGA